MEALDNWNLTKEEMRVLGRRIKYARRAVKLTQSQVAAILDCSEAHISAIENGKTMVTGKELVLFCKKYDRGLNYYFEGIIPVDDSPKNQQKNSYLSIISDRALNDITSAMKITLKLFEEELHRRSKDM